MKIDVGEETFDYVLCDKGLHPRTFLGGECLGCAAARRKKRNRRRRALWAQSHVRYDTMRQPPDWVPVSKVIPIIERWLAENDYHARGFDHSGSPVHDLAQAAGVSGKTLHRWRTGEISNVREERIDRMLSFMGLQHLWHTEIWA